MKYGDLQKGAPSVVYSDTYANVNALTPTEGSVAWATDYNIFGYYNGSAWVWAIPDNMWMPARETLTYATATTITISGDVTARYGKGTRLKLTQTSVKYFVVVGASESGGTTTLTITGGDDYTLVDATIVTPYYSYGNPPDWPDWFNWTPSWSGSGSLTFTSVSLTYAAFKVEGRAVTFILRASGTTGGTGSGLIIATLPVQTSQASSQPIYGRSTDGGSAYVAAMGWIVQGPPADVRIGKYDYSNWALGTGRDVQVGGTYQL